jgi:hypothetical protein
MDVDPAILRRAAERSRETPIGLSPEYKACYAEKSINGDEGSSHILD